MLPHASAGRRPAADSSRFADARRRPHHKVDPSFDYPGAFANDVGVTRVGAVQERSGDAQEMPGQKSPERPGEGSKSPRGRKKAGETQERPEEARKGTEKPGGPGKAGRSPGKVRK